MTVDTSVGKSNYTALMGHQRASCKHVSLISQSLAAVAASRATINPAQQDKILRKKQKQTIVLPVLEWRFHRL